MAEEKKTTAKKAAAKKEPVVLTLVELNKMARDSRNKRKAEKK